MTPQWITGLAVLLLDLAAWLKETDPETLDLLLVDALIDSLAERRKTLVADGAR